MRRPNSGVWNEGDIRDRIERGNTPRRKAEAWDKVAIRTAIEHGRPPNYYRQTIAHAQQSHGVDPWNYFAKILKQRESIRRTATLYNIKRIRFGEPSCERSFSFPDIILQSHTNGNFLVIIPHKTHLEVDNTREQLGLPIGRGAGSGRNEITYIFNLHTDAHEPPEKKKLLEGFDHRNPNYARQSKIHAEHGVFPEFACLFRSPNTFVEFMMRLEKRIRSSIAEPEYHDRLSEIAAFAIDYVGHFNDKFPGGNIHVRENYPVFKQHAEVTEHPSRDELALYAAACTASSDEVLRLLQDGVNPNAKVSRDISILGGVITIATSLDVDPEQIFLSIRYLIRYGADINSVSSDDLNVEHQAVSDSRIFNRRHQDLFPRIIELLKASRTARPLIKVHRSYHRERIGKPVHGGNLALINRRDRVQANISGVRVNGRGIEFKGNKGRTIRVETKPFSDLNTSEFLRLFLIFRLHFTLDICMTIKAAFILFVEKIWGKQKTGEELIDLIKVNGEICAFNKATVYHTVIAGEPTIIHHVDLAVATVHLNDFRRFMTAVAHWRGHALKRCFPEKTVITAYSAISYHSLLQANGVRYYPKYNYPIRIIKQLAQIIAPHAEIVQDKNVLYIRRTMIPDAGQAYERRSRFESQNNLEHAFWSGVFPQHPEHGMLVAIECNEETLRQHADLINPYLEPVPNSSIFRLLPFICWPDSTLKNYFIGHELF